MLRDILSGGVYGAADSDRQHSSTITLNAVEAARTGGKSSQEKLEAAAAMLREKNPDAAILTTP